MQSRLAAMMLASAGRRLSGQLAILTGAGAPEATVERLTAVAELLAGVDHRVLGWEEIRGRAGAPSCSNAPGQVP
jgi:hypothetical protein